MMAWISSLIGRSASMKSAFAKRGAIIGKWLFAGDVRIVVCRPDLGGAATGNRKLAVDCGRFAAGDLSECYFCQNL